MKRTATAPSLGDQVMDIAAQYFVPATLDGLAKMRLSPKLIARVDRLAEKANDGALTSRERREYQSYIEATELLTVLQLRARLKLGLPIPAE